MNKPLGPYSPLSAPVTSSSCRVRVGCATSEIVDGGVTAQTTQTMANVADRLAAGAALTDVVKTLCFLTDMGTSPSSTRPTRTRSATTGGPLDRREVALPGGMDVEVEVWAYKPA